MYLSNDVSFELRTNNTDLYSVSMLLVYERATKSNEWIGTNMNNGTNEGEERRKRK